MCVRPYGHPIDHTVETSIVLSALCWDRYWYANTVPYLGLGRYMVACHKHDMRPGDHPTANAGHIVESSPTNHKGEWLLPSAPVEFFVVTSQSALHDLNDWTTKLNRNIEKYVILQQKGDRSSRPCMQHDN